MKKLSLGQIFRKVQREICKEQLGSLSYTSLFVSLFFHVLMLLLQSDVEDNTEAFSHRRGKALQLSDLELSDSDDSSSISLPEYNLDNLTAPGQALV